ncbi:MAG: hypothetical protein R3E56_05175 [Burkholderiaceae bacterium]
MFVRSPRPHADIRSIDVEAATSMPGSWGAHRRGPGDGRGQTRCRALRASSAPMARTAPRHPAGPWRISGSASWVSRLLRWWRSLCSRRGTRLRP